MKISGFGSNKVSKTKASKKSASTKGAKGKASVAHPAGKSSGDKADRIEVADHLDTLEMIRGIVEDTPDIRAGEVDRVVDRIRSGQYKINFEKVAEGFIKDAIMNELAKKGVKKKA